LLTATSRFSGGIKSFPSARSIEEVLHLHDPVDLGGPASGSSATVFSMNNLGCSCQAVADHSSDGHIGFQNELVLKVSPIVEIALAGVLLELIREIFELQVLVGLSDRDRDRVACRE
jgi:hypothetical protein